MNSKVKEIVLIMVAILMIGTSIGLAEKWTCNCPESQFVWVRVSPSKNAAEWGKLHAGDTIDAEGVENGYIKFTYEGRKSYVSVNYFEIPEKGKYVVQANGRVAKRNKPGGKNTGWLNPGIKIEVLSWHMDSNGIKWAKVYGGQFVKEEFLKKET